MKGSNYLVKDFYSSRKIFIGLFIITVALMQWRQHKITNFNCEICSDKAGYYMYLPATFYQGYKAENYPRNFDSDHGLGFTRDTVENKIVTKFTYGVSLLQFPFYGIGFMIDQVIGLDADPWSYYYLFFINLGAAFYLIIGLYVLRKWYAEFTNHRSAWFATLLVFVCTNLFYYTIDESLMSHVYSFSMFAIMLYSISRYTGTLQKKFFVVFCIATSIAILIRPTNVIMLPFCVLIQPGSMSLKNRLIKLITFKNILLATLILGIVVLPQCIYWKFAYGKWVVWSYQGEGFKYWKNPQLLTTLFSPQSGLFIYTPVMLLSFLSLLFVRNIQHKWAIGLLFIAITYLCASWHNPYFGSCNFGKRAMIEYYPVLMLPILFLITALPGYRKFVRIALVALLVILVYHNVIFTMGFNTCFFGEPWGWEAFGRLMKKVFLFK